MAEQIDFDGMTTLQHMAVVRIKAFFEKVNQGQPLLSVQARRKPGRKDAVVSIFTQRWPFPTEGGYFKIDPQGKIEVACNYSGSGMSDQTLANL